MRKVKSISTVQILIFFNLLLAVVAFIKDIFLASYFGTSKIADALNLAFFIPDTIGNNLIGAGIAISSIPAITRLSFGRDISLYQIFLQKLVTFVLLGTLTLWIITVYYSKQLFQLFHITPHGSVPIVLDYFQIMAPIIIVAPLWLLGSAILQSSKHFLIPAVSPILYNLLLLVCLTYSQLAGIPKIQGGRLFSIALSLSTGIVGLLTWLYLFKKQKLRWTIKGSSLKIDSLEFRRVGTTFSAYLFILLFGQTALLFERFFASSLNTGTIAALTYAYRISQFPLWVFIAAINTFILPTISTHAVKNDFSSLKRELAKSFIVVIVVSALLSLLLVVFSQPLLKLVLGRGSFDLQSVKLTSTILKGYGLSILGQSLYVFCTRYYVAEGQMSIPLLIGLIGCVLNIVLLKLLVPILGAVGIGYSVAISSTFNGVLILAYFIKNLFSVEIRGGVTYE